MLATQGPLPSATHRSQCACRDAPFDEILLLCLLAVLAGAEAFTDIARFGEKKLDLLRRFRPFANGTPAHDHLGDIFATLDAQAFQRCFVAWVSALTRTPADVIAIDGKTSRRSGKKGSKEPIHVVSAFAARQRLVMGQVAVAEKSNEIVAIPALLDMMAIEGAVVTIDAMGCQRTIAKKITDKKADYIIALKGNQGTLHDDVKLFVAEQKAVAFRDTTVSQHETVDGEHGRIETRRYTAIHDVDWLQERHAWPGLAGVVMVESRRQILHPIPLVERAPFRCRAPQASLGGSDSSQNLLPTLLQAGHDSNFGPPPPRSPCASPHYGSFISCREALCPEPRR